MLLGSCPGADPHWTLEVDVKARTRAFDTPDSFPFPTIIVEPRSRYDKRDHVPDWYAMVSQLNHGLMFLPGSVPLSIEEKRGREYYTAPKEEWYSLADFLATLPEPLSPSEYGLDKPKAAKAKRKKAGNAKKAAKKKRVK